MRPELECAGCDAPITRDNAITYTIEYTTMSGAATFHSKVIGHYCGQCLRHFTGLWKIRRPRKRSKPLQCHRCDKVLDYPAAVLHMVRYTRKSRIKADKIHRSRRMGIYCHPCMEARTAKWDD